PSRCRPSWKLEKLAPNSQKSKLVPLAGLEPARCCHHLILSQARLPIPPQGLVGDHSGEGQPVNGPIPLPPSHRYMDVEQRTQTAPPGAGMSEMTISMIRERPVASAAAAIAAVGAGAILGAWIFQYGFGLKPCPLCLEQRYAYYFAIPLAVLVILGESVGSKRKVLLLALGVI